MSKIKVIYPDGRHEIVKVTPRVKIECEKQFKGIFAEMATQGSYWMAWWLLKKANKTNVTFDHWIDNEIEDCERIGEHADDLRGDLEELLDRFDEAVPVEELRALLDDAEDAEGADPTPPEASTGG